MRMFVKLTIQIVNKLNINPEYLSIHFVTFIIQTETQAEIIRM